LHIGTNSIALQDLSENPNRADQVKKMIDTFSEVLGQPRADGTVNPEMGVAWVVAALQNVLGISELTQLRRAIAQRAIHDASQTMD
jgi:hypothetical protein